MDQLIDQTDGSYFELKDRLLCKISASEAKEQIQTGSKTKKYQLCKKSLPIFFIDETSSTEAAAGQDNRDLCDDGSANQSLQHDEIQQLRSEGVSGQEIISKLVSKSATFEKKTAFSQQKYLNKKKKK